VADRGRFAPAFAVESRRIAAAARPIVWAIGGSDSGGGAGIQADTRAIHALGGHACTVISAVTAQNSRGLESSYSVPPDAVIAQWQALYRDLPPTAIKIGMLPDDESVRTVATLLDGVNAPRILDPVRSASAGGLLSSSEAQRAVIEDLLPRISILTPNLPEAAAMLGRQSIDTAEEVEEAAQSLAAFGPETVVIKGGHAAGALAQDCVFHRGRIFWLSSERIATADTHGTGCTFAAALAAAVADGMATIDALVVAKMFVREAIRNSYAPGSGEGCVSQQGSPECEEDLPWLTASADEAVDRKPFAPLEHELGIYAIVDSAAWVERLVETEVGAIQLRVKGLQGEPLREEIRRAIGVARNAGVPLFINDFWREAIELGAFGVHLGQEDLATADTEAIRSAGLRLGISTHSYEEVARAHALRPSYMAIGPVFETKIKVMNFAPQGLGALGRWRRTLRTYPLVAIGGIDESSIGAVAATGVDSVAVIRAISLSPDPGAAVRRLAAAQASAARAVPRPMLSAGRERSS
jgi:hydroxymethylpyrimidine kinase / phosphomethylpyrimidine kinase / thiamine-phosphate diphosphorylase